MKQFTSEEIQDKFEMLPQEMQDVFTSTEISDTMQDIGKRHSLKLDQEGILFDQTAYVILGLMPSKDFVANFSKEAGVDTKTATAIAKDINDEVFGKLKSSMRSMEDNVEEQKNPDISAIERVGGFSVEPPVNLPSEHEGEADIESKESLISGLENPAPANAVPMSSKLETPDKHTEAIVDHLLSTPTAQPLQKVSMNTADPMQKQPEATQKRGPDSYREPIQ